MRFFFFDGMLAQTTCCAVSYMSRLSEGIESPLNDETYASWVRCISLDTTKPLGEWWRALHTRNQTFRGLPKPRPRSGCCCKRNAEGSSSTARCLTLQVHTIPTALGTVSCLQKAVGCYKWAAFSALQTARYPELLQAHGSRDDLTLAPSS